MKRLTFALLLFSALGWARAATRPLPGEYTGEWRGRIDPELPAAVRTVHVTISTNGAVLLSRTEISPITGGLSTSTFYGAIQRNGIIRGGDNWGKFRAVPRENGHALRGVWFIPTRYGPVSRLRFYAHRD